MNKTYNRKNMTKIHGIEIKSGMIIITNYKNFWIVFPVKGGLGVVNYGYGVWNTLDNFIINYGKDITIIKDKVNFDSTSLNDGDTLWENLKK